jgi:alpha-1,2-mannosyltransferase
LFTGLAGAVYFLVTLRFFDFHGAPEPSDFGGFCAAGTQVLAGHAAAAYDWASHWDAERALFGAAVPHHPWLYPPWFLLVTAPLALLPYAAARLAWVATTAAAYAATIRGIDRGRGALLLVLALAYTGASQNLLWTQTGFLSAALLGGGALLVDPRPWLAGILFGALVYKPQLGLLLPFALIAGRHWRTLSAAASTVLVLTGLTLACFGTEIWVAFANSVAQTRSDILDGQQGFNMITVYAAVRRLGGAPWVNWAAQAAATIAAAATVAWTWRRPGPRGLKAALLLSLVLLATPYAYQYDLAILGVPIALLVVEGLRTHFLAGEHAVLAGAYLFPLACVVWLPMVMLTPLVALGLALLALRRLRAGAPATLEAAAA